jgi:penicillin-binding protein 1A
MEFGPTAVARTAYRLGIASKLEPNPSLALGTSEVSLIELVSAYAPFANGGRAIAPYVVERVGTRAGRTLYQREPHDLGAIVEPRYVAMMNAMMRETIRAGTAQRAQVPGWQVAGKTGTSQDFRDAWFVGYTALLVTGVWLGNDDSSPTRRATGSGLPVDIWTRFMRTAHQGVAAAALPAQSEPLASIFHQSANPNLHQPANPKPPAGVGSSAGAKPQPPGGGLDGWLIDRLFGRR